MANNSATDSNIDFLGADEDWDTVVEESGLKLSFDNKGEQFVGRYIGTETITNPNNGETFDQQQFRDPEGTLYAINGGYKLQQAVEKLAAGDIVRITYMGDIDMGPGKNPMKDFRVDVKRGNAGTATKEAKATADTPSK